MSFAYQFFAAMCVYAPPIEVDALKIAMDCDQDDIGPKVIPTFSKHVSEAPALQKFSIDVSKGQLQKYKSAPVPELVNPFQKLQKLLKATLENPGDDEPAVALLVKQLSRNQGESQETTAQETAQELLGHEDFKQAWDNLRGIVQEFEQKSKHRNECHACCVGEQFYQVDVESEGFKSEHTLEGLIDRCLIGFLLEGSEVATLQQARKKLLDLAQEDPDHLEELKDLFTDANDEDFLTESEASLEVTEAEANLLTAASNVVLQLNEVVVVATARMAASFQ